MSMSKGLWVGAMSLMMGAALLAAPPSNSGSGSGNGSGDSTTATPRRQARAARLTRPWSELSDLTEDEKAKILEVHRKALDEIRQIQAKEHSDILAFLTDSQRKEVADLEAKQRQQRSRASQSPPKSEQGAGANGGSGQ